MSQAKQNTIYDYSAKDISGEEISLERFRGKVLLVVNVASRCGFTPQYDGLQALYNTYRSSGFEVLGFPCNQFGEQEPGDEKEIQKFCSLSHNVTFPMFSKVEVNGPGTHPLFEFLKSEGKGFLGSEGVKWNFTKFLVGRDGKVIKRFAPQKEPASLEREIQAALEAN